MSMAMKYGMMKRAEKAGACPGPDCPGCSSAQCMAEGGMVHEAEKTDRNSKADQGMSKAGEHARYGELHKARDLHLGVLTTLEGEKKRDRKYLAEGGEVSDDDGSDGIVDRIMKRFAKGGAVEPVADFEKNDFDVMDTEMDPGTDADYTGANSGDEIGDEQEDDDRKDIVGRIMKSRSKRDRMPRPA